MSTPLYPTKTRLALLEAIGEGEVWQSAFHFPYDSWWQRAKVTARCDELLRAGWVTLLPLDPGVRQRWFALTDAGRAVLDAAGES